MRWLPLPADFRADLDTAAAAHDAATRLDHLAALARTRLDPLQTLQLDRALARTDTSAIDGWPRLRVALLSDATVEHLLPAVRVAGLRHRLLLDAHAGPFGQVRGELLDPSSRLHRARPDVVVLSCTAREWIGDVPLAASAGDADAALARAFDELQGLWQAARGLGASVVQQTLLDVSDPVFGDLDRQVPGAPARLVERLNLRIVDAAAASRIAVMDLARAASRDGLDAWFDRGRWYQGKMEIAPQAAPAWGERLVRTIAAQRGASRKCLVLDLDDTLWGGVVGDDGLEGIVLGPGSAAGEAHLALQRHAKRLSERGIVLAVCSKNEPAIVERVFREHPEMLLRAADIAAFEVSWDDKAQGLRRIAERLNLGLDSLVFVDDNPAERERVRASLPMVAVPELPDDVAQVVPVLADAGCFEAASFTDDDRRRSRQYTADAERTALREAAQNVDAFLHGLRMVVEHGPVTPLTLARATQLVNKTNQFNATTQRLTPDEVAAYAEHDGRLALQFRLVDRLGDNGLVSVVLLRRPDDAPTVLEIDNWVMSCRVFGRRLEHEILNVVVEAAQARGIGTIVARHVPSGRNGLMRPLLAQLGFVPDDPAAPADAPSRWTLRLDGWVAHATPVARWAPAPVASDASAPAR